MACHAKENKQKKLKKEKFYKTYETCANSVTSKHILTNESQRYKKCTNIKIRNIYWTHNLK